MTDALLFPGLTPAPHRHVERFLRSSPSARARFEECSDVLGFDLEARYRDADIYDWMVYEVAFLAINLSVVDWAEQTQDLAAPVVCGQSFGGYCAAVWSGAVSMADMARLLRRSAEVEHDYFSTLAEPLACTFFSRVGDVPVDELIAAATEPDGWAELSVRHDRGIFAVSGTAAAIARLEAAVRARRGIVYYTVNRAEHCPRMWPVRERVRREVFDDVTFVAPEKVYVSDVSGAVVATGPGVAADLLDGWTHPTVADTLYDGLVALGVDRLVIPVPRGAFRGHGSGRFTVRGISPADVSEAVA